MLEIIAQSVNCVNHADNSSVDDKAYELMFQLVDIHNVESKDVLVKTKPHFINAIESVKALCEMEKVK